MAEELARLTPLARVAIFGPRTPAVEALLRRQARGEAPANLEYRGYVTEPAEALAEIGVVVNLSRFQESFGRTVLEAMAAGRPVVAYEWGALPELIAHGETGLLVPFGNAQSAAEAVMKLAADQALRQAMGAKARQRALACFSPHVMTACLKSAYRKMGLV